MFVKVMVASVQMILLAFVGEELELTMNASLPTLVTVTFSRRTCSPGRKMIVVLEVKYCSVSLTYSESVWQKGPHYMECLV